MKKYWPIIFSSFTAISLAIYLQAQKDEKIINQPWKTFVKKKGDEIKTHNSTDLELKMAHLKAQNVKRDIASEKNDPHSSPLREGRLLIGDIQGLDLKNPDTPLKMKNSINPNWKDILGQELLRFQDNEVKVLIKEEFSLIKITHDEGEYLQQVIITYVLKNGEISSFRALIDSKTGSILETWDKTINESSSLKKIKFDLPFQNNNGIIGH